LFSKLLMHIRHLRGHQLTRNASWILLGQGANFFLQAGSFILLARLLGAKEYGIFAGVSALVNTVAPYSAMGAGTLFMRYVTEDRENASIYWGNAILTTVTLSCAIAALFAIIGPVITGNHNLKLIIQVVLANCLFSQIVTLASRVFQTYERMRWTAVLTLLANLVRVLTVLVMMLVFHRATAVQWSVGILISSSVTAIIAARMVQKAVAGIAFKPRLILRRAWEGLGFASAGTTQAIYNDLDKTLLSHYGFNRENGFYSLAYRIIDFAATPVGAIDVAVMPRYFNLNRQGLRPVIRLAAKSLRVAALLGVVIAVITWGVAPLVPHLVGRDFSGVLIALHWLCMIPLLRGIHTVSGSALSATGHQHMRLIAQVVVAAMNLGLNIWWIPIHGWIGAAWSSVISDGVLALTNISLLVLLWRRGVTSEPTLSPSTPIDIPNT